MSEKILLYDLAPSPNNMKVRIALNYKGIPFERVPVDPNDRTAIVRASGQPLTPVLAHGDRIVFDSAAILRYLEANFRDTPPLFSASYETMTRIEQWEKFGRYDLLEPTAIVFRLFLAGKNDASEMDRASRLLNDLSGRLEGRLRESPWLVGEAMTAADVTAAPAVWYGMLTAAAAAAHPVATFFAAGLGIGDARERTREWAAKVMAFDR